LTIDFFTMLVVTFPSPIKLNCGAKETTFTEARTQLLSFVCWLARELWEKNFICTVFCEFWSENLKENQGVGGR
jgi:hypothetical protein